MVGHGILDKMAICGPNFNLVGRQVEVVKWRWGRNGRIAKGRVERSRCKPVNTGLVQSGGQIISRVHATHPLKNRSRPTPRAHATIIRSIV